jgi:translation initiation factor IF-1
MKKILKSYFYWTYPRGCFHYDVMVTLILAFIFLTPHIPGWDFGDKPPKAEGPPHPIQVVGDGGRGFIVTVQASDVNLDLNTTASNMAVKKALRKAIEPVTGDAVAVERWETFQDAQGNWTWRVWARR